MGQEYQESSDLLEKLPDGSRAEGRFVVIYDGACYFCVLTSKFLRSVDFLKQFSFVTLQEFSWIKGSKIPYSLLQESIHVVDRRKKKVWQSTDAISRLLLRSPPAFPILLLLLFLRLIHVAEPAYHWVAQSRYAISSILKG